MALDRSYFRGELALPQLATTSAPASGLASLATQTVGENTLEWFIAQYEEEFLRKLLGDKLYDAYYTGLKAETPLDIWIDLDNRIYIVKNGCKFSPAANYVYFYAMQTAGTQPSMTGEVRHKPDFSVAETHKRKMVAAWNNMANAAYYIRQWIWHNRHRIHEVMPEVEQKHPNECFVYYWGYWFRPQYNDDFRVINMFGL